MSYEFSEAFAVPESPLPKVTGDHAQDVMAQVVGMPPEDFIASTLEGDGFERRCRILGAVQDFMPPETSSYFDENAHNRDLVVTAGAIAYELLSVANVEPLPAVEKPVLNEMWAELETDPDAFHAANKSSLMRHNAHLAGVTTQILDYMYGDGFRPDDAAIIENVSALTFEALRRQTRADIEDFTIPDVIPEGM